MTFYGENPAPKVPGHSAAIIDGGDLETDVTELCRALPAIDDEDMLGLSELKFDSEGGVKKFEPWPYATFAAGFA